MVKVFVAVEIAKFAARRFRHKDRIRIVGAIIAGHTERQTLQVLLMRFGGLRSAALECLELSFQCGVHRYSPVRLRPGRPLDWTRAAETARGYNYSRTQTLKQTEFAADRGYV